MLGVIISLAIVSSVLFYVDSTSEALVSNAVDDVAIDISVSHTNIDEDAMKELKQFIIDDTSDLILSADVVAGAQPFFIQDGGAVVSTSSGYEVEPRPTTSNANYTTTYLFGLEPSYFELFPLFQSDDNISEILESGEVLVSSELANAQGIPSISDTINVSLYEGINGGFKFDSLSLSIAKTANFTVANEITFDTNLFMDSIYAFFPDLLDSDQGFLTQFIITPNIIIMDYTKYLEFIRETPDINSFNSVHVKIDHDGLSSDLTSVSSQLAQITNRIEVFFPETTVTNLLSIALVKVEDQLNQMKLFMIYFALPGLFLGGFISKYAIDISIEERNREIGLLRTKAAKRKKIALIIALESLIVSFLGLVIGILSGYALSSMISSILDTNGSSGAIEPSLSSLTLSIGIGVLLAGSTASLSTKQLLAPSVVDSVKAGKEVKEVFWKRIYLDIMLLGVVFIIYLLNFFNFNPIPGFAVAVYDFLAPLLTWLGLALLLVRGLGRILQSLSGSILILYSFIFKDLSTIIIQNVLYRSKKISKIAIVLSLTISFGLTIITISETYQLAAIDDAQYQAGSDVRIQFPDSSYINYNTSDLTHNLIGNFTDQIEEITSIYQTTVRLGRTPLTLIGVETDTFFDVAMIEDYFFVSGSADSAQTALLTNTNSSYNSLIFSETITNPTSSEGGSGGRGGGFRSEFEFPTYSVGEELPIFSGETEINVKIADITTYFPMLEDATGIEEEDLRYAVANVEFLLTPIPENSSITFLSDGNATISLIKIKDDVDLQDLTTSIIEWYSQAYPNSGEIAITTSEDTSESNQYMANALIGLTSMEFILVLAISFLSLQIFLTSSFFDRKKEFGTYFAIGAPVNDIRKIILGEISLITVFSIIAGSLLSLIVSTMYLGFLSDLLILEVFKITVPIPSALLLIFLVIMSMVLTILISSSKLSKLDPANVLRTV
jgi:ABC-type antimicrobial peptide transport system permease subunit